MTQLSPSERAEHDAWSSPRREFARLRVVGIAVPAPTPAPSARIIGVIIGVAGTAPPTTPIVGIIVRTPAGPVVGIVVSDSLATPPPIVGIAIGLRSRTLRTSERNSRSTAQDCCRSEDEQPAAERGLLLRLRIRIASIAFIVVHDTPHAFFA